MVREPLRIQIQNQEQNSKLLSEQYNQENIMLEDLKEPISKLKEDIMNVWGRL